MNNATYIPQDKPTRNKFLWLQILVMIVGLTAAIGGFVWAAVSPAGDSSAQRVARTFTDRASKGQKAEALALTAPRDAFTRVEMDTAITQVKGSMKKTGYVLQGGYAYYNYAIDPDMSLPYKYAHATLEKQNKKWRVVEFTLSVEPSQLMPH